MAGEGRTLTTLDILRPISLIFQCVQLQFNILRINWLQKSFNDFIIFNDAINLLDNVNEKLLFLSFLYRTFQIGNLLFSPKGLWNKISQLKQDNKKTRFKVITIPHISFTEIFSLNVFWQNIYHGYTPQVRLTIFRPNVVKIHFVKSHKRPKSSYYSKKRL